MLLLEAESNQIGDGSLIPVMSPDEALPGQRAECRKRLPIPGHWTDCLSEDIPRASDVNGGHQPAAGTPGPFTFARMN